MPEMVHADHDFCGARAFFCPAVPPPDATHLDLQSPLRRVPPSVARQWHALGAYLETLPDQAGSLPAAGDFGAAGSAGRSAARRRKPTRNTSVLWLRVASGRTVRHSA